MITIDVEAKRNKRLPLDIDKFCRKYKTKNNLFVFTSPDFEILDKHLYYLLVNSEEKPFDPKYRYKPSYMSYDEYGTTILEPILMYVNNVMCIEDFNLKRVVVPTLRAIKEVCKDKFSKTDVNELTEVNW